MNQEMVYEQSFFIFLALIKWLIFPILGYLGWHYYNKARHEERKLLIEQGTNPDEVLKTPKASRFPWLKIGVVVTALGIGLFIITLLINFHLIGQSEAIFPAILCLCGGLGLIIANYMDNHKKSE